MTTAQGGSQQRLAGVHVGNALLRMALIYKSSAEAVAQAVENGLDADASHVWVVVEPNRLSIIDNGHGMVKDIPARDVAILEKFGAGEFPAGTDVRKLLSPAALRSIERMMGKIAHSSKIPGENLEQEGTRGIGFLGVYQYAQQVAMHTRPRIDLAKDEGFSDVGRVPVHSLTLPTRQQLADDDTRYSVEDSVDFRLVADPFGHPLAHGTRVEVSNFLPGQGDNLLPGKLSAHFVFRFGNRIRRSKAELVIIDRVTKDGKRTPGGKVIYVHPIVYKGVPLLDEDVQLPSGGKIHLELYEKGGDFGSSVQVTRQGSGKFRLTELEGFHEGPWTLLKGFVEFPFDPAIDDVVWDSSKTTLLQSPQRAEWERVLHTLESRITNQLAEAKKRSQASGRRQLSEDLGEVTAAAIRAVPFFSELLPGRKPIRPESEDVIVHPPKVLTAVEARVVNEHGQPVAGVVVRLSHRARSIAEAPTNKSGEVSFGQQPVGKGYMLAMDTPSDATCDGEEYDLFDITEEKPGYRLTFRLITGQEAPAQKQPRPQLPATIRFLFHTLEDGRPYQQRLGVGVIEVNPDAPDFAEAEASGDDDRRDLLVAQYTAAALTEHASPGEIREGDLSMLLIQQSLIFARISAALSTKRNQRQVEAKRRSGRNQRLVQG